MICKGALSSSLKNITFWGFRSLTTTTTQRWKWWLAVVEIRTQHRSSHLLRTTNSPTHAQTIRSTKTSQPHSDTVCGLYINGLTCEQLSSHDSKRRLPISASWCPRLFSLEAPSCFEWRLGSDWQGRRRNNSWRERERTILAEGNA